MNRLFFLAATIAVTLLSFAMPALQASPASQMSEHRRQALRQLKTELGLSDEQVARIRTEFRAQKDQLKQQVEHVKVARANLRKAVQSGASEHELRAAATILGSAEGDLALARSALFARIKPILTPDQLAKFQELQASR